MLNEPKKVMTVETTELLAVIGYQGLLIEDGSMQYTIEDLRDRACYDDTKQTGNGKESFRRTARSCQ